MKHHYNKEELIELKRKYDMQVNKEAIEEIKHTIDLDREIERLNNIINDIKEYVNFLVIFNQTINGKFSETQWGQDILDLIGSDKE